jgi:hypothetical protein
VREEIEYFFNQLVHADESRKRRNAMFTFEDRSFNSGDLSTSDALDYSVVVESMEEF